MWIIAIPAVAEHNLTAQERWLKPGSTFSVGRNAQNSLSIETAKSVSKQHVEIKIGDVLESAASDVSARSELTIHDLNSKFKSYITIPETSTINVEIEEVYQVTTQDVLLRLGKVQFDLKIIWRPFVLTLSNIKLSEVQRECEILDLRNSKDYVPQTTHVVTSKLNTPKTLQALVERKWIVGLAYVHAMVEAADGLTRNMENLPDPSQAAYLPDDDFKQLFGHAAFLPTPGREVCFTGLEFVFFDAKQYQSLKAPIIAGGGKAFEYNQNFDMQEIPKYLERFSRAVVVLPREKAQLSLLDELLPIPGAVSITQGDFINIIMSNGSHTVYRGAQTKTGASPVTPRTSTNLLDMQTSPVVIPDIQTVQSQPQQQASQAPSRRIGSRPVRVLATFEDDLFGGGDVPVASQQASLLTRTQGRKTPFASQAPVIDDEEDLFGTSLLPSHRNQAQAAQPIRLGTRESRDISPQQGQRKRPIDSDDIVAEFPDRTKRPKTSVSSPVIYIEEDFEAAPTAAALSKRLLQKAPQKMVKRAAQDSEAVEPSLRRKKQKQSGITEEDIQKALLANKQRAELQSQVEQIEDDEVPANEDLKNLGTVEYFAFELPDDSGTSRRSHQQKSARWDPKWDGRKNFKAFRRAEQRGLRTQTRRPAIMIRLVEAKASDRALMDQSWLETATTRNNDIVSGNRANERVSNLDFEPIHTSRDTSPLARTQNEQGEGSERTQRSRNVGLPRDKSAPRTGTRTRQNPLFTNDDSDSDDDPLKFRL